MKYTLLFIYTCFIISCATNRKATNQEPPFASNVIVAHRGAWKKQNLPENSIASLKWAINLQCTGAEFDVRMTADDSLIINHDPQYNKQSIEKTTYNQLVKTPLSNGEKLPPCGNTYWPEPKTTAAPVWFVK